MKGKVFAILLLVSLLLTGCGNDAEMERVLALRQKLQTCTSCSFTADITADYGEYLHTFTMDCVMDAQGNVTFTVIAPDSISGITGIITDTGGSITFTEQVLAFPTLADGQITPVSAPWVLMRSLRGGYLRACSNSQSGLSVVIDDTYQEDSLQLDIWLNENDLPIEAEILWQGRRVLSLEVSNLIIQ